MRIEFLLFSVAKEGETALYPDCFALFFPFLLPLLSPLFNNAWESLKQGSAMTYSHFFLFPNKTCPPLPASPPLSQPLEDSVSSMAQSNYSIWQYSLSLLEERNIAFKDILLIILHIRMRMVMKSFENILIAIPDRKSSQLGLLCKSPCSEPEAHILVWQLTISIIVVWF